MINGTEVVAPGSSLLPISMESAVCEIAMTGRHIKINSGQDLVIFNIQDGIECKGVITIIGGH